MDTSNHTTPMKTCTKCGGTFPATREFFHISKGKPTQPCKPCASAANSAYQKEYIKRPEVREHRRLRQRAYRERTEVKQFLDGYYQREDVKERYRRYYEKPEVKERIRNRSTEYRTRNSDLIKGKKKAYYRENRARILEKMRERRENATPEEVERRRRYGSIIFNRRRARLLNLDDTFTLQDWHAALDYFDDCCAACGRPIGFWHTLAKDHWIPLTSPDCPGTIPTNIIPLCHGIDGCNNSKGNKAPKQWLIERFGKRKAAKILARVRAYFEWVEGNHINEHERDLRFQSEDQRRYQQG